MSTIDTTISTMKTKLELILKEGGQEKLLPLLSKLDEDDIASLYDQLASLPCLKRLSHLFQKAVGAHAIPADELRTKISKVDESHYLSYKSVSCSTLESFWQTGLKAIAKGQVAVILMAGGQGTRLGVSYPKGMFKVGLPSGKSLFQLQAERVLRLQYLARLSYPEQTAVIPWYIMTSEATKIMTQKFFEENSYFGLDKQDIIFFEQGLMPCFDFDGNILLESKRRVALSPDGNGGLYEALIKSGCLKDMSRRKIKYAHAYCVDNILVRVADPIFIGFCIENNADCGNKVVEKKVPSEPIGVVCHLDGVGPCVVEYSEMPMELNEEREEDGRLVFRAGNIANHFFTVDFLNDICDNHIDDLLYHVAKKKIPCVDSHGDQVKPVVPNGIKLEKFVFDVFPLSKKFFVWEVAREDEFSPLKNAEGSDSPVTCCKDLYRLHKKWLESSGAEFSPSSSSNGGSGSSSSNNSSEKIEEDVAADGQRAPPPTPVECEISPLITYRGEDLVAYIKAKNKLLTFPVHLS